MPAVTNKTTDRGSTPSCVPLAVIPWPVFWWVELVAAPCWLLLPRREDFKRTGLVRVACVFSASLCKHLQRLGWLSLCSWSSFLSSLSANITQYPHYDAAWLRRPPCRSARAVPGLPSCSRTILSCLEHLYRLCSRSPWRQTSSFSNAQSC